MGAPTMVDTRTLDELLDVMVTTDGYPRVIAWCEALEAGYGGVTVADFACGSPEQPLLLTLTQLYRHLVKNDNAIAVGRRGFRLHTHETVQLWSADDGGRGPALAGGPR